MKIAILDYGAGNLHSLAKAVAGKDFSVTIEADAAKALRHDALILPGVGAFGLAAQSIAPHIERLRDALNDGFPCLGICLGMQLLFENSEEGDGRGIGVIPGYVRRLRATHVPQIGWNDIEDRRDAFYDASGLSSAYFANSFVCEPEDASSVTAYATHESDRFAASIKKGSVVGVQFHPEKSSLPGVAFIDAFLRTARE
jgi:imidazole glycerol phosphate synthase, glutamine amidotransferase subunit